MLFFYLYYFLTASFSPMEQIVPPVFPQNTELTISAIGDNTIGHDISFGYSGSFIQEIDNNGMNHPFQKVSDIFKNDDLTIANLETTLTNYTSRANKTFRFAGKPEYRDILKNGGIDAVNLANNHTMDYLQQGYKDTIANLETAGIDYFGENIKLIKNIKGVNVGMLGYCGWYNSPALKDKIKSDITELKKQAPLVIVSFHWGQEGVNYPNSVQKDLGRFAIGSGADLVLGHHPHVIQGIENYKGKNIIYSLGNFVFGGNKNPRDKDTFIYQQNFIISASGKVTNGTVKLIPASISSVTYRNNYQPRLLEGNEKETVLNRLRTCSNALDFGLAY